MTELGPAWKKVNVTDWHNLSIGRAVLKLQSTMPMLQNNFPARVRQEILAKQRGVKVTKKEPKDVDRCFLEAMILIGKRPTKDDLSSGQLKPDAHKRFRFAMPAVAFKDAAIEAANKYDDIFKTDARAAFWIVTEKEDENMVPLDLDSPPYMREDVARQKGTIDIRIRPCFESWRATLNIEWSVRCASWDSVYGWFRNAGRSMGIGDWRLFGKSSTGMYGGFEIVEAAYMLPDEEKSLAATAGKKS